jgi:hypothetical protein
MPTETMATMLFGFGVKVPDQGPVDLPHGSRNLLQGGTKAAVGCYRFLMKI